VNLTGGVCVVQDPEEALHASMPRSAMAAGGVHHVLPVAKIPDQLAGLVKQEASEDTAFESELMEVEAAMADLDLEALNSPDRPGKPSGFSCPDCHGSLFEISEGGLVRFRCRVGHAWSPGSLVAQQSSSHETALWVALRSLEEKAALTRDLGERAIEQGHRLTGGAFSRQADEALRGAALVRDLIDEISGVTAPLEEPGAV
jgi:two-component system chemotaxis response regulator CheB